MNAFDPIMPEVKRTWGGTGENPVADRGVELNRLFGRPDPKPQQVRKYEQPWHRVAAHMYAQGCSQKDIAAAVDRAPQHVSALVKNPWFQQTVFELQKEHGLTDVMEVIKGECLNSVQKLVELRDSVKTPASVVANISFGLLYQHLGKPTQRIETKDVPTSEDPVAEVARLEKENALLQQGMGAAAFPNSDQPGPSQRAAASEGAEAPAGP